MRQTLDRCLSPGMLLAFFLGLVISSGATSASSSSRSDEIPPPGTDEGMKSSSRSFEDVWYRTPEKRGKFSSRLASGTLTVGADTISFMSKKITLSIATDGVKRIATVKFRDDPANVWTVVEYEDGGSAGAAAFKGAGAGKRTAAIEKALESTWLAGAPASSTVPAEKDISAAIETLRTSRLESLYYNNGSVPKNVWNLVFMPGIDDALMRAYRMDDRDDLFRFTLIMVLNRRAAGLTEDEARRKVRDCMMEAVRNDRFNWVKVEARDALRRLGAEKAVLRDIDTLIEKNPGAEVPKEPPASSAAAPAMADAGAPDGRGASPTTDPPSWGDIVHDVCVEVESKSLAAQGHGEKSELMAHLVCQVAAAGCRDNPAQAPCQKTLRALDEHLRGSGSSMLFAAARGGRAGICKTMIELGSDVNAAMDTAWTPLMIAAAEGHREAVTVLLDAGADPNARNGLGQTALMAAARMGHLETVEALLSGGADPALSDGNGHSALDLAEAGGHSGVARLLETGRLEDTATDH